MAAPPKWLAQLQASYRGVAYALGRRPYLAVTNACNSRSLVAARGPGIVLSRYRMLNLWAGFSMPLDSGFEELPDGFEPTSQQLAECIECIYQSEDTQVTINRSPPHIPILTAPLPRRRSQGWVKMTLGLLSAASASHCSG